MIFCPICNMFLHITFTENKLNKICNNCHYKTELSKGSVLGSFESNINVNTDLDIKFSHYIHSNILPITRDFKCPNKNCESENYSKEAVFFRPYKNDFTTWYSCRTCGSSWKL